MIPKRIICTHRSEFALSPKLRFCMQKMRELHPRWEWEFFSDADCENFIKTKIPEYQDLYFGYPQPVMRADCFRLLSVYHLGGFYLDTDFLLDHPLDPLCKHRAVFPWEIELTPGRFEKRFPNWYRTVEKPLSVGNYAFGAEAGHPFLRALIDELIRRTESFEAEDCSNHDVMFATGPDMLTTVYYRDQHKWEDVEILSHPRAGLGHYGLHFVTGSWWQNNRNWGALP